MLDVPKPQANPRKNQITAIQWLTDWYPMGKTSIESRLNISGKWGWMAMESVGFITLLYIMYTLPAELGLASLPWGNWTMAGCFVSRSPRPPSRTQSAS